MRLFLFLSVLALLSCHPKELSPLDEGYPVNLDGTRITTYNTQKLGGSFDIQFNGHDWNHYGYCVMNAYKSYRKEVTSDSVMIVTFTMLSKLKDEPCAREILSFIVPLQVGGYSLPVKSIATNSLFFRPYQCDYGRELLLLTEQPNWLEVNTYDYKSVSGKFHVYFKENPQHINVSPIYPGWIEIQGSFSRNYFGEVKY